MITSFEVGAVFKIINQASPALAQILRQIREINLAVDNARKNLALINKPIGIGAAIGETNRLAAAWRGVAANATAAQRAIRNASAAALPAGFAGGGGRGGPGRPGWLRGGGHISGPSAPIPGGGHVRFGGGAMAGLGLAGFAVYQAAAYEDATVLMAQHAGREWKANGNGFGKILQDAGIQTGFGEHDISLAAQQELRMFGDTGGSNGVNVLPKMLRYAATEARLKGTSLEESMSSLTGLAHMLQRYGENDVDKIAPAFSALSTRNPMSLAQQERAFGYAVPLLHSSLGIDPFSIMAGSTALARAGITNTKGGTWLREMAVRAMPGTSLMSKVAFRKHEEALKAFGLIDEKHKPTWFTDGHGDFMKLLKIASDNAARIPMEKRASFERQLFGAQGSGALAVLSEPAVRQQMGLLYGEMTNPETVNRVRNFMSVYGEQSTVQGARTGLQEFNVLMSELGTTTLPAVNSALRNIKTVMEGIRGILPGTKNDGKVGGAALTGAAVGAGTGFAIGKFGGPAGALSGAVAGGVLGAAYSFLEQSGSLARGERPADRYERKHAGDPSLLGAVLGILRSQAAEKHETAGERYERRIAKQAGNAAPEAKLAPLALTINLDGRTLAQAMSNSWYSFPTQAPAADGMSRFFSGNHNTTDK